MRKVLNPELVESIDAVPPQSFIGEVWRVTWATRDPLAGNAGGGRWSPDNSFEAFYTSLKSNGAMAEVYHHLSRAPVFSSSNVNLNRLSVSLNQVLRLNTDYLKRLGLDDPLAHRVDYSLSQSIGAAAHMLDFEGILVPGARWDCENLVIFLERIDIDAQITVSGKEDINWPAWREMNKL
jgi:hypothetical protein